MSKRLTTEEFIKRAKEVHGDKYDYSKVEYVNNNTKVCIVCLKHGEFWQRPMDHLNGRGCARCGYEMNSNNTLISKEEFIKRAKEVHGDKYDYSKVELKGVDLKVCIICPEHGEFWQIPKDHMKGRGCAKCGKTSMAKKRVKGLDEFVKEARKVHGDRYDYSKVEYTNNRTKVCIICPEHGEFWQRPYLHLSGANCPTCQGLKQLTTEEFVKRAKEVHGDKYDYSKVEYKNLISKVSIICRKHGEFEQIANGHLVGQGCPLCSYDKVREKLALTQEEFVEKAKQVHGDLYDYSKTNYVNMVTPIVVGCHKHGYFCQKPAYHLSGRGCSKCNLSSLEKACYLIFDSNGIKYDTQKTYSWLGLQRVDFYLSDFNIVIECQGSQHFFPVNYFNGINGFNDRIVLDINKFKKCQERGIKILYYTKPEWLNEEIFTNPIFEGIYSKENTFTSLEDLLNYIKNNHFN